MTDCSRLKALWCDAYEASDKQGDIRAILVHMMVLHCASEQCRGRQSLLEAPSQQSRCMWTEQRLSVVNNSQRTMGRVGLYYPIIKTNRQLSCKPRTQSHLAKNRGSGHGGTCKSSKAA